MLNIYLQGVKSIYKMKDTTISLNASVIFEATYYTFNGTTYKYGEYPTSKQINNFVDDMKDIILRKIKQSVEE